MDIAKIGYCRLCAMWFPNEKLINLLTDSNIHNDIVSKLVYINAKVDLNTNNLPKTICLTCNYSLDSAYQFTLAIEQAQSILADIILQQNNPVENEDTVFSDEYTDNNDMKLGHSVFQVKVEAINEQFSAESKAEKDKSAPSKLKQAVQMKNFDPFISEAEYLEVEVPKTPKGRRISRHSSTESYAEPATPVSTWKGWIWICCVCETQFNSFKELTTHSVQCHSLCNTYRCTDCGTRMLNLKRFLKHVKRHRPQLRRSCYLCHRDFKNQYDLRSHVASHLSSGYMCEGCHSTFANKGELSKHLDTVCESWQVKASPALDKMRNNFTCLVCNKTFRPKSALYTHLKTHTERTKDHTCERCGKSYYTVQSLVEHRSLHDNVKSFNCEICKTAFRTERYLRNHVNKVHSDSKPYSCDECGKSFHYNKDLVQHSRIHTDEKPFQCLECSKAFRFKSRLDQHMRQHTGEKPYSCTVCHHAFTNWPNYNKHMVRRHNMDTSKKKRNIRHVETNEMLQWKAAVTKVRPRRTRQEKVNAMLPKDREAPNIAEDIGVERRMFEESGSNAGQVIH